MNYNQCRAGSLHTFHVQGKPSLPTDQHDNSSNNKIHNQQQRQCTIVNYDNMLNRELLQPLTSVFGITHQAHQCNLLVQFTRLWDGLPRNYSFILSKGKRYFSTPKHQDQLCSPPRLYLMGAVGSCPGEILLDCQADHSHPPSAKRKNKWRYTSTH